MSVSPLVITSLGVIVAPPLEFAWVLWDVCASLPLHQNALITQSNALAYTHMYSRTRKSTLTHTFRSEGNRNVDR
jgi:hypothetical protein